MNKANVGGDKYVKRPEILEGESVPDDRGLRSGTSNITNEETKGNSETDRGNGEQVLQGDESRNADGPDVGNDSEGIHGGRNAENAPSDGGNYGRENEREVRAISKSTNEAEETDEFSNSGEVIDTRVVVNQSEKPSNKENFIITNDIAATLDNGKQTNTITADDIKAIQSIKNADGTPKSVNQFTAEDIKKTEPVARRYFKEMGVKSPFFRAWFGDWRANDKSPAQIVAFTYGNNGTISTAKRIIYCDDIKINVAIGDTVIKDSLHYGHINGDEKQIRKVLGKIDSVVKNGILLDTKTSSKSSNSKKGSTTFVHYLYTPLSINGAPFVAKVAIEEYDTTSKRRAYNLRRIEMSELSRAQFSQIISENREKYAYNSDIMTVSQLFSFVKQYDKKFNPKPSSKIVNEDGTPKLMYHGTNADNITAFDLTLSNSNEGNALGKGIYLSSSKGVAKTYGANIYELYADIKNPFEISKEGSLLKDYNKLDKKYNISKYYGEEYLKKKLGGDNFSAFDLLKSLAKKNNIDVNDILLDLGYDGIHDGNEWVAFKENQVKSATDNIGTFDGKNNDIRFSIANIQGNNGNYGIGVYLDTNIFDGIHPRNWGKTLAKYVYDNLAGKEILVKSSDGKSEIISFAKTNERITKDDAVNSHKVIEKLARTKGNTNKLAVVHIEELLNTAKLIGTNTESSHQWLDQNGWEFKTAYLQDVNGGIYTTTLNIANTRDGRKMLYGFSNTKRIDEGDVPSTRNGRGSLTNHQSFNDNISQPDTAVKTYFAQNEKNNLSESEGKTNGRTRNDLLFGNGERTNNESTGEQAAAIYQNEQRIKGEDAAKRKEYAEDILKQGNAKEKVIKNVKANIINAEAYNDDMNNIAKANKEKGLNTHFYIGRAVRKFDSGRQFLVDGFVIGKDVYLRYDGEKAPQQLNLHELAHFDYKSSAMQTVKEFILNKFTDAELNKILDTDRYKQYNEIYNGKRELVLEEFIADVMSGMSEYTDTFAETVNDYWNNNTEFIEKYSPAEYARSIDGGTNQSVKFKNDNSLSYSFDNSPYREYVQLRNYIVQKNNSSDTLLPTDCKEIGDNFYIWNNISKTDFTVVGSIPIVGNEGFINAIRSEITNGTYRGTENFNTRANRIRSRKGIGPVFSGNGKRTSKDGSNDRFSIKQSDGNKGRYNLENSENVTQLNHNDTQSVIDNMGYKEENSTNLEFLMSGNKADTATCANVSFCNLLCAQHKQNRRYGNF